MTAAQIQASTDHAAIDAAEKAARAVPPLWPLASSVAVNPFLGQSHETLPSAAARIRRVSGCRIVMDRAWFKSKLDAGAITDADLQQAWEDAPVDLRPESIEDVKASTAGEAPTPQALPTVADLAADASGIDWRGMISERVGLWAASYFDEGQAFWPAAVEVGAWRVWRDFATRDLCPEIAGLRGFAKRITVVPLSATDALAQAAAQLRLPAAAMETYFHRLLMDLGGWAQTARYRMWQAELAGETDTDLLDLVAISLQWEAALLEQYGKSINARWDSVLAAHAEPVRAEQQDVIDGILQQAAEHAAQRSLVATLKGPWAAQTDTRPDLHAVFCIDVRSEVFRRALETVDSAVRTSGFAGFFGVAVEHKRYASDTLEPRCPVLLRPHLHTHTAPAPGAGPAQAIRARIVARTKRAWGRFKLAAVSSFAFVEAAGLLYGLRLIKDALGLGERTGPETRQPVLDTPLTPAEKLNAAETVLRAMSMTHGFARLVVLAGHGATVANNPHASALQCGACGGYSGEANAQLLAALLNDAEVRGGLVDRGIEIPDDTLFIGALHDTTTDDVHLFEGGGDQAARRQILDRARDRLAKAGTISRTERALRLPGAPRPDSIARRGLDWSQIRPEWGLTGCQAFVAAPRPLTAGKNLGGRAFLHDYDWRQDEGFRILELILTAPVVVASWISLQYYGSTVAPAVFGAGNKLLHNVTGGMGVFEGNVGTLRTGLPWQSVHDGDRYVHEPLRLSVFIAAPSDAIAGVLEKHEAVRALAANDWIHLFAVDDESGTIAKYMHDGRWRLFEAGV